MAKLIAWRNRKRAGGVDVVGDVNAAIAANVGESASATTASSRQHVVHRAGSAHDEPGTTANRGRDR